MTTFVNFRDLAFVNGAYMFLGGSRQTRSAQNPQGEPRAASSILGALRPYLPTCSVSPEKSKLTVTVPSGRVKPKIYLALGSPEEIQVLTNKLQTLRIQQANVVANGGTLFLPVDIDLVSLPAARACWRSVPHGIAKNGGHIRLSLETDRDRRTGLGHTLNAALDATEASTIGIRDLCSALTSDVPPEEREAWIAQRVRDGSLEQAGPFPAGEERDL